jgi:hypothetical protein
MVYLIAVRSSSLSCQVVASSSDDRDPLALSRNEVGLSTRKLTVQQAYLSEQCHRCGPRGGTTPRAADVVAESV